MELFILWLVGGIIGGFIGMAIGDLGEKRNGPAGFLLGFLFGPIGWIVAAVLPPAKDASKATPAPAEQQRIARLEAELAALKRGSKPPSKSIFKAPAKPGDDPTDGTIPTYKLD